MQDICRYASPEFNRYLWSVHDDQCMVYGDQSSSVGWMIVSCWLANVLQLVLDLLYVLQGGMNGCFSVWSCVMDLIGEDYAENILKGFATLGSKRSIKGKVHMIINISLSL